MHKKTILIDLDGVLNTYNGEFKPDFIPDLKAGAFEFIQKLAVDYEVKIFTTRNKILAAKWAIKNGLEPFITDITNIKELCWLFVDDRCINFDGDYEKLFFKIRDFKPWYKN